MKKKIWLTVISLIGIVACALCLSACGDGQNNSQHTFHTYVEKATDKYKASDADCIHKATYYKSCSVCGKKSTETFEYGNEPSGHDFGSGVTCTKCSYHKPSDGLVYEVLNGTAYVSGIGTCIDTAIYIADSYKGYHVTKIGDDAFNHCAMLTSVTIPNSVTSIGNYAFRDCTELTSISIPDGITSIGLWSFSSCYKLSYNTYDNAKYLGNQNNPYVVLISVTSKSITFCNIHEKTKIIYNNAFTACTELTSITIPNNVMSIGYEAFLHCSELTTVSIRGNLISIGYNAFEDCNNLSFNVYDNADYLGNRNNPYLALISEHNRYITSFKIHENTEIISDYAFYDYADLKSITIPNNVTIIGNSAFSKCTSLTNMTIPNSVTCIGSGTFSNCTNLTNITIPGSVTSIGDYAFCDCTGLSSVTIDNGVISIGDATFYNCANLTSVTIPDSIKIIGEAFNNCPFLTDITYQGTKVQWESISKSSYWNTDTGEYTVHCTDGNISKADS